MKHAQATDVQVTLSWIGDKVVLDIEDNGIGFDAESAVGATEAGLNGGYGLTAMEERVTQSGGELFIESDPDEGTTVSAILPVVQVEESGG